RPESIPNEVWPRRSNSAFSIFDFRFSILDLGLKPPDCGLWTVDFGLQPLDVGCWMLDVGPFFVSYRSPPARTKLDRCLRIRQQALLRKQIPRSRRGLREIAPTRHCLRRALF